LIPKNIIHSLERQDLPVLYAIKDLVERLITERENATIPDELPVGREVLREEKLKQSPIAWSVSSAGRTVKAVRTGLTGMVTGGRAARRTPSISARI
jgi:hypothetical protein